MTPPAPAAPPRRTGPVVLLVLTLVALTLVGGLLALVGGFLSPTAPRLLGVPFPLGAVGAAAANLGVGLFGGWGTGTRAGSVLPGLGWLGVVLPLASLRPEGDLIVTGSWSGIAFLLLGVGGWVAAALLSGRRQRGYGSARGGSGGLSGRRPV